MALRLPFIMENYDHSEADDGIATYTGPAHLARTLPRKQSNYSLWNALTSSYMDTCLLLFAFALACFLCTRRLSSLATKKQFHHSAAYSCATSRSCRYIKRR